MLRFDQFSERTVMLEKRAEVQLAILQFRVLDGAIDRMLGAIFRSVHIGLFEAEMA